MIPLPPTPPTIPTLPNWCRKVVTAVNELIRKIGAFGSASAVVGDYTVTDSDYLLLVDATSGPVTVALPANRPGKQYVVKKVDASGNGVTIDPDGSETIDGAANKVIGTQWQSYTIMGIPGGWAIL